MKDESPQSQFGGEGNIERLGREQTREEIEALVAKALEKGLLVDVALRAFGSPVALEGLKGDELLKAVARNALIENPPVSERCLLERTDDGGLGISRIEEDGDVGHLVPIDISQIKSVALKGPFQSPNG